MITGETATPPAARDRYANEQLFEQPSQVAATSEPGRAGALAKSDELAGTRPQAMPLQAPPPALSVEAKDKTESFAQAEQTIATGSNIPMAQEGPKPGETPASEVANRKLVRNA